jgi:hypothetical protein
MHANEVVDSIATPLRGTERDPLPRAGFGQCAAWRHQADGGSEHAVIHALIPKTLTHFPGP